MLLEAHRRAGRRRTPERLEAELAEARLELATATSLLDEASRKLDVSRGHNACLRMIVHDLTK